MNLNIDKILSELFAEKMKIEGKIEFCLELKQFVEQSKEGESNGNEAEQRQAIIAGDSD